MEAKGTHAIVWRWYIMSHIYIACVQVVYFDILYSSLTAHFFWMTEYMFALSEIMWNLGSKQWGLMIWNSWFYDVELNYEFNFGPFWMTLPETLTLHTLIDSKRNYTGKRHNFVFVTVFADGLTLSGVEWTVGTVITMFASRIYTELKFA